MGNPNPVEQTIAQTEIALAILREPALNALLQEGRASTFTSSAKRSGESLTIVTEGLKSPQSVINISGSVGSESKFVNPMVSGIQLFNPGAYISGNFVVRDAKNQVIERDQFNFFASHVDDWYSKPDKATIAMVRRDAAGKLIQHYEPAVSEVKYEDGRIVNDPNGQPVRIARPTEGAANCGLENPANPGNRRKECDYIIHDAKNGDLSYNETQSQEARTYYRSVVRDMKGKVLGIVEQTFQLNSNGDLVSVVTSARKPVSTNKN